MKRRGSGEGTIYEERPGRWIAQVTVGYKVRDGKRRRIRRKFVAKTRGEVAKKVNNALSKKDRGEVAVFHFGTVGEFLEGWLENTVKPTVRPKTYRSYKQTITNHLLKNLQPEEIKEKKLDSVPGIGKRKLRDLTVEHLEGFFTSKLKAGNSPALVRYLRVVLRVALNEALRRGKVERNVAALVRAVHVPKPEFIPFTLDEAKRLLAAAKGHRLEALFTVALAIGLRHGEALALLWDEVDLKAGELRVNATLQRVDGQLIRTEPKSEESRRVVPLAPFCVDALKRHRKNQQLERAAAGDEWQETGYVFTSRIGTPLIDRNVLRDYYKLLDQAKLPRRRFHDLRHAAVSLLAAQGVDDKTIAEIVGHSDVRLTKNVYQHAEQKRKRAATAKLGRLLSKPAVQHTDTNQQSKSIN